MCRSVVNITAFLCLLVGPAFVLLAQPPAAQKSDAQKADPAAGERGAPQRGERGARGKGGERGKGGARAARSATVPAAPGNTRRHDSFVARAKQGDIDLLFVGDSITDWWVNRGKAVWDKEYVPLKAANFGIAGDTTQGVLWRMQNGELEGFKAKLIILMLGTNNIGGSPPDQIAEGDRLIVEEFKKHQPQAKVLVLGVFPRGAAPTGSARNTIKEINQSLAKLDDGKHVFYMDIGDKFLAADGTLTTEVMGDGLHPTLKGYEIWADAIRDKVKELMK